MTLQVISSGGQLGQERADEQILRVSAMPYAISIGFLILAVLHASPALLALRPELMASLYGPAAASSGLGILLHHRAMMFMLVVLACIAAAFMPQIRSAGVVLTGWSMIGFLVAYWLGGSPAGALHRIALADLACVPVLLFLVWAVFFRTSSI
ncbi:hypothetical protein [Pyruvatibacter sp.]|uniref:hypothetical protein n=1 Tax=Pyruvatibacter sp. TaxID=1981328 RepID=UPI0032EE2A1C